MAKQKTAEEQLVELEREQEKIQQRKNELDKKRRKIKEEAKAEQKRKHDRAKIIIGACLAKNVASNQLSAIQTLFMTYLSDKDAEAVRAVYPHLVPRTSSEADDFVVQVQEQEDEKKTKGMSKEEIYREIDNLDA